jgi:hypothetical protein
MEDISGANKRQPRQLEQQHCMMALCDFQEHQQVDGKSSLLLESQRCPCANAALRTGLSKLGVLCLSIREGDGHSPEGRKA